MTITQRLQTLQDYMELPWTTEIRSDEDGGFVLTVWPLNDFAVFGESRVEVETEWRGALASHLDGYLKVGKSIPTGNLDVALSAGTSSSWVLPSTS